MSVPTSVAGWHGPGRHRTAPIDVLVQRLRDMDRRLASLERGAPGRASGVTFDTSGIAISTSLGVTGATSLGTSTSIAGTSMAPFISTTNGINAEVVAGRGTWPSIGERMTQIRILADAAQATADAVESEVTAARAGHPNLDARLDDMAGDSGSLGSRMTAAEGDIDDLESATTNLISAINAIHNYLIQVRNSLITLGEDPGTPP